MTSTQRVGNNLVLSSILAFCSYVPFEYVAKVTLIVAVALFILDPVPPVSRIVSLVITVVVLALAHLEKTWRQGQTTEEAEEEEQKKEE
jgi:flagellar biosynthesis component FlhA